MYPCHWPASLKDQLPLSCLLSVYCSSGSSLTDHRIQCNDEPLLTPRGREFDPTLVVEGVGGGPDGVVAALQVVDAFLIVTTGERVGATRQWDPWLLLSTPESQSKLTYPWIGYFLRFS